MDDPKKDGLPADLAAQLEAARARQAARDNKVAQNALVAAAQREIKQEALESLLEKLADEYGGPFYVHGDQPPAGAIGFVLEVPASDQIIAVKRGPGVLWNRYETSKKKSEDDERFILPCVVRPSREEMQKLLVERPAVLNPLVLELAALYGFKLKEDRGK